MMHCVNEGHEIVALANLKPQDKDELDSYMYQTVGHHAIELYAEAMDLPLYRRTIQGSSLNTAHDYVTTLDDEVEDLYQLLKQIKEEMDFEAVSAGAILSNYQRVRVEHVCARLGVTSLAYLWRRPQVELLADMVTCHVHAVLIKVAALGLTTKHLGKSLAEMQAHLLKMERQYGLHPCGEGGEYETFTLDCPLFKKALVIEEQELIENKDDVAYLNLHKLSLRDKPQEISDNQRDRVKDLPLPHSSHILSQLYPDSSPPDDPQQYARDSDNMSIETAPQTDARMFSRLSDDGWLYMSGLVGRTQDGETIEQQTQAVMGRLKDALAQHGFSTSHLAAVHVYVRDMQLFARVNAVYKSYFSINPPVRVCVALDLPRNVSLQLDAAAHMSDPRDPREHVTMHVQSVSYWAAANIGPYSQCVQIRNERAYVAGQIALVPGSQVMLQSGVSAQARLCLTHVQRVLTAMQHGARALSITCARTVICYVTAHRFIEPAKEEWERYLASCAEGEDEDCETTRHKTFVEYVVIPALPRDALIEWHVWATPRHSHIQEHSTSSISSDLQTSCKLAVSTCEELTSLSCRATLTLMNADHFESSILPRERQLECLRSLYSGVHACAAQARDTHVQRHLGIVRVFYHVQRFSIDTLIAAHEEMWRAVFGDVTSVPCPAFVPVRGFYSNSQLLSLCQ